MMKSLPFFCFSLSNFGCWQFSGCSLPHSLTLFCFTHLSLAYKFWTSRKIHTGVQDKNTTFILPNSLGNQPWTWDQIGSYFLFHDLIHSPSHRQRSQRTQVSHHPCTGYLQWAIYVGCERLNPKSRCIWTGLWWLCAPRARFINEKIVPSLLVGN